MPKEKEENLLALRNREFSINFLVYFYRQFGICSFVKRLATLILKVTIGLLWFVLQLQTVFLLIKCQTYRCHLSRGIPAGASVHVIQTKLLL